MTKQEAHELLNAAQAGLMVSSQSITEALMATGDLSLCQRSMEGKDDFQPRMVVSDGRLRLELEVI
jgi:hypothetical protein